MRSNRKYRTLIAAVLAGTMLLMTACGSGSNTSSGTVSGTGSSEVSTAESSESFSESDIYSEETESEVSGPYQDEFEDYRAGNDTATLTSKYDAVQFDDVMYTLSGDEMLSYSAYLSSDENYLEYSDGGSWLIRGDKIDGFDSENTLPFRAVYTDEGIYEEYSSEFDEMFGLYDMESVDEKSEGDDIVTFTSYVRDTDAILYQIGDGSVDVPDGAFVKRETIFDKSSKELVSSTVSYYSSESADPVTVEEVTLTTDVGENSTAESLIEMTDAEDSHSITITIDPGTADEKTVTSSVGKGCYFNLLLDDYSFYTDKACTQVADESMFYDTEKDLTVYAKYDADTIYGDESGTDSDEEGVVLSDIDGEEFNFDVSSIMEEAD